MWKLTLGYNGSYDDKLVRLELASPKVVSSSWFIPEEAQQSWLMSFEVAADEHFHCETCFSPELYIYKGEQHMQSY
jgi:hypothetical protein